MDIKAIVSDLDDTLLLEDHRIGQYSENTLKKAQSMGVKVILASGRSPESMVGYAGQLGLNQYYIANNGATIVNATTGDTVRNLAFTLEQTKACLAFAQKHGIYAQTYLGNEFFYSQPNTQVANEYGRATRLKGTYVENLAETWHHPSSKIVLIMQAEKVDELWAKGEEELGDWVQFTTSKASFLELVPKGATKGKALEWLEENGVIDAQSTMVFGDSINDLSMLNWAGYPVAIGNAREELKAVAKYTAPPHNEEGVAQTVEKFVVKGEHFID